MRCIHFRWQQYLYVFVKLGQSRCVGEAVWQQGCSPYATRSLPYATRDCKSSELIVRADASAVGDHQVPVDHETFVVRKTLVGRATCRRVDLMATWLYHRNRTHARWEVPYCGPLNPSPELHNVYHVCMQSTGCLLKMFRKGHSTDGMPRTSPLIARGASECIRLLRLRVLTVVLRGAIGDLTEPGSSKVLRGPLPVVGPNAEREGLHWHRQINDTTEMHMSIALTTWSVPSRAPAVMCNFL